MKFLQQFLTTALFTSLILTSFAAPNGDPESESTEGSGNKAIEEAHAKELLEAVEERINDITGGRVSFVLSVFLGCGQA